MQRIIRWRWPLLAVWIVATVVLTVIQPDVNAILHERGQNPLSADSRAVIAHDLLKKMSNAEGRSDIVVFFKEEGLSEDDMKGIQAGIGEIKAGQEALGAAELIDPFSSPEVGDQLISKDRTTVMAPFVLQINGRSVDEIGEQFAAVLKDVPVQFYLTGEDFIENDYLKATIAGVEKSAALTVIFILVVLLLMFRSALIPIVSLLTVGISYLVSMGIAAQLIDKLEFPITSVTQMLLVLILFGIGTDYNILLFNRFKEELALGKSTDEAIVASYRTAGKTIIYSILTVFIAFAGLTFSDFGIYQSANVVAIGTVILVLVILTLTPFVMKTFGAKLFWPSRGSAGHKESGLMAGLTRTAVKRPIVTVAVIAVLLIPVFLTSGQKLSFDQLAELGDDHPSTKGFGIVAERFSRGQALPTTLVIEGKEALDNNEALAVLDDLTNAIREIPGVNQVSGVTQPEAKPIDDFYIKGQTAEVTKGISASRDGVDAVRDGLDRMRSELNAPDFSQVAQLAEGTGQVRGGLDQVTDAVNRIVSGIGDGASGGRALEDGIAKLRGGMEDIAKQTGVLADALDRLRQGYDALGGGYAKLGDGIPELQNGMSAMNGLIAKLGQTHAELAEDEDYAALKNAGQQLSTALASIADGFSELERNSSELQAGFASSTSGLRQLAAGQQQIVGGLAELEKGAKELSAGLAQGQSGGKTLAASMERLSGALADIEAGQLQLNEGLGALNGGFDQLKDGLQQSGQGLSDISDGLKQTGDFLVQMGTTKTFFIPREALDSEQFGQAKDAFMSKDRTVTKLIVVLNEDPYSPEALKVIDRINDVTDSRLDGTVLADAARGAAGPTSITHDMNESQLASFNSAAIIVIVSVFLVLLMVIRSLLPALYIVVSLIASYYVAMGASKLVAEYILGTEGLSSFVPFFSFIVIVAVGVDYGIFLMMRYKEYGDIDHQEAIKRATRSVGGVIISAMIILGGTFATLMPSGLVLLIEMATAVIVGLIVLVFVLLPMLVPALMALPGALRGRKETE
ncbi:MMPL family transporter [Cohnella cellulosilytica]|uniref:MMPL family transporter n=1 Tax=Cohnella cellulosilytica TaxID=986710 RepID=A0ABW2FM81_9BACL